MTGGPSFYYSVSRPAARVGRVTTSRTEVFQIGLAYAVLSVDLLLIISQSTFLAGNGPSGLLSNRTPYLAATAALAALTGFIAHEMAHKIVAERRGYWAEFRMWPVGLAISFITALTGFLWGAPGATVVGGMSEYDRVGWGKTSLAGPLTNVAFGGVFYAAAIAAFQFHEPGYIWLLFLAYINGWFATFNLIPFGPLDGRKVMRWSVPVWAVSIVVTGTMAVVGWLAYYYYGTPFLGF